MNINHNLMGITGNHMKLTAAVFQVRIVYTFCFSKLISNVSLKMRDNIFRSAESNQGDQAICHRSLSGVRHHTLTIEVIQQPNFIMTYWLMVCDVRVWPNAHFRKKARFLYSIYRPYILIYEVFRRKKALTKIAKF